MTTGNVAADWLIDNKNLVADGMLRDIDLGYRLAEIRRRIDWVRRQLYRDLRSGVSSYKVDLCITAINCLRAEEAELAPQVIGWERIVQAIGGGGAR